MDPFKQAQILSETLVQLKKNNVRKLNIITEPVIKTVKVEIPKISLPTPLKDFVKPEIPTPDLNTSINNDYFLGISPKGWENIRWTALIVIIAGSIIYLNNQNNKKEKEDEKPNQ